MKKFIDQVVEKAKKNNIHMELADTPHVQSGGINCSGYFTDFPKLELLVATKKPQSEWMEILVHESCHMDQYLEKSEVWKNLSVEDTLLKQTDILDLWLGRKVELSEQQLRLCIDAIINVELDCEKRSVEAIKKNNLPIDVDMYIKKANSYVLFYHIVKQFRQWSKPGKAPYMIKEVVDKMPADFNLDYENPPKDLLDLIERHCMSFY